MTGIGTPLSTTGFELLPGSTSTVTTSPPWSGRFWARTLCSIDVSGKFNCGTADCGSGQVACNGAGAIPPASLVEFTIAPTGGVDYFDISLVDGFNLPVSVTPMGGTSECQAVVCAGNVNAICPPELAIRGQDGAVIACKSACMAFNQPEFCCSGDHNQPQTCPPTDYSTMRSRINAPRLIVTLTMIKQVSLRAGLEPIMASLFVLDHRLLFFLFSIQKKLI